MFSGIRKKGRVSHIFHAWDKFILLLVFFYYSQENADVRVNLFLFFVRVQTKIRRYKNT